jgi:hypothetical protein
VESDGQGNDCEFNLGEGMNVALKFIDALHCSRSPSWNRREDLP